MGTSAARGLSCASTMAPTSLAAIGPLCSETLGCEKLPVTRSGVRRVSGLKSFGLTTARRSKRAAGQRQRAIHQNRGVRGVDHHHPRPQHAALGHQVGHRARHLQRVVALDEQAQTFGDVDAGSLDEQMRHRSVAQFGVQRALHARQDGGRGDALPLDEDAAAELPGDVGRCAVRPGLAQPLLEPASVPAQISVPQRQRAAAVELHIARQAAAGGAGVEGAQGSAPPPKASAGPAAAAGAPAASC